MKTVASGVAHEPVEAEAPGIPYRARRNLAWVLAVCVALLGLAPVAEPARADDFDRLLHSAESSGTVSVLVTGWHAITGDEADQGSSGGGLVAITGDEFVKKLEGSSRGLSVTRRYRNFPVLAMEMDTDALEAAKAHGSGVEIWEDPVLEPLLSQSVDMVGAREVWSQGYTGRGRYVVVIDTGVDAHHPFLAGERVLEGCYADVCPNGASTMLGRGAAAPVGSHGDACRRHHRWRLGVGGLRWRGAGVAPHHDQCAQPGAARHERAEYSGRTRQDPDGGQAVPGRHRRGEHEPWRRPRPVRPLLFPDMESRGRAVSRSGSAGGRGRGQ